MGIIQFLILLTVPGLFFYSCLKKDVRDDLGTPGKYAFIIGVSIVMTTILAVATATINKFWLEPIVFLYIILLPISLGRLRGDDLLKKQEISWKKTLPILLGLLIICFLYFQPTQYFMGGRDPGIYVNSAIHTSNTGEVQKYDPLLNEVKIKYPKVFQDGGIKFLGYYLERSEGQVYTNPQFYPGYTLWLSIAHTLLGMDWFLYITPLFGILSLLILYTAVKELFGKNVAAISTVLISVNIAQVWYVRSPYTEILAQLLLWFNIFILFKAHKNKDKILALLGGFTIGASILVRLDIILVFIPLTIYFIVVYAKDNSSFKRWWGYYILSLVAVAPVYLGYVYKYGRTYTKYQLIEDNGLVPNSMSLSQLFIILGIIALIGVFIIWLLRKLIKICLDRIEKYRIPLINILSVLCVIAFIYMYFVRPHIVDPYSHLHAGRPSMRAETLVRVGWYISFVGIWTALAAFIYKIRQKLDIKHLFYFMLVFFNFTVFLYDPKIHADHFWAVRRHVPFIIPTFITFMAIAVDKLYELGKRFKAVRVGAALLAAYFMVFFLYCTYPFIYHTEYKGVREGIEAIARQFDQNDIVITSDDNMASRLVGTPLDLIYDKQILPLNKNGYDQYLLSQFIKDSLNKGKDVYLLLSELDSNMETREIDCTLVDQFTVSSRISVSHYYMRPNRTTPVEWVFNVYKCTLNPEKFDSYRINVGQKEDDNITIRGVYDPETNGEIDYRWTEGVSNIKVVLSSEEKAKEIKGLTIRAANFLGGKGSKEVNVYVNGDFLDTIMVTGDFREHFIEFLGGFIPDEDIIDISFETSTQTPKELGMGKDERELGIVLDWVSIERQNNK